MLDHNHSDLQFISLRGSDITAWIPEIARLRMEVFKDFPYYYDGTMDYEVQYLSRYGQSPDAFIFLVRDPKEQVLIGMTSCNRLLHEDDVFKKPLVAFGLNPERTFYFGESILLKEYRRRKLGHLFFEKREEFSRSFNNIETLCFCAIDTSTFPPERNYDQSALYALWDKQQFKKIENLSVMLSWKTHFETIESEKKCDFWLKKLGV